MQLPFLRGIIQEIELARTGFILGTLIEAGLPVVDAIDSLVGITNFDIYRKFYSHLKGEIEDGKSFGEVFRNYPKIEKIIPSPVQQMIITGEKSGRLSDTLIRVGENYESKIETTTKNLSILLEPILLIIVWVGVMFVALAVILPIYSLIGGLNQGTSYSTPSASVERVDEAEENLESEAIEVAPIEDIVVNGEGNAMDQVGEEVTGQMIEESESEVLGKLIITETETGYLNVRSNGSVRGDIVDRVNPGDEYDFIEESNGWSHVVLSVDEDGNSFTGWVINEYIEIINE